MKCFLAVNQLNDPCFIDYDESFGVYIISTAKEKGLLGPDDTPDAQPDANLVMQLFSPLVLSQWLLVDQTREPCSSIHCPNGFCLVFHHVDDLLFICINGDGTESETFLHKKIQVFINMMRFLFGPVNELMVQTHAYTKRAKWEFLRKIMKTWADLAESEQSFLVEAVERLHVNQIMNEKCVEILKKSIKHMQAARGSTTQHAIMLAKSKLLALYSNRSANELLAKDLLSLMIMSKTLHPSTDTLEDLFSKNYTGLRDSTPTNEMVDWGEDEYHSAPNTPKEGSPTPVPLTDNMGNIDSASQGLEDSLEFKPSSAASDSGTIENDKRSDTEGGNFMASQDSVPSLLQMYKEKYPNSSFEDDDEPLTSDKESVAKPGDTAPDLQNSAPDSSLSEDVTMHSSTSSPKVLESEELSQSNPELVGEDPNAISVSVQESPTNETTNSSAQELVSGEKELGSGETVQSTQKTLNNEPSIIHAIAESTSPDESLEKGLDESKKGSFTEEKPIVLIEGTQDEEDQEQKSSSDQVGDHPETLIMGKSRSPTLSSNESPGLNSLLIFEGASRSSSVLSQVSAKYPALSPQLDDFRSFPTSPVMEESGSNSENIRPSPHPKTPTASSSMQHSQPRSVPPSPHSVQQDSQKTSSISNLPPPSALGVPITDFSFATTASMSTVFGLRHSDVYVPQSVFLETSTCLYSPYCVDVLQVLPGITLVLLSEVPHRVLADTLYQVIHNIQDLLYGRRIKLPRSRSLNVYDIISSLLSKLHSSLRKFKGRIRSLISDINSRWEKENLKSKLLDYLEKDTRAPIPLELESSMLELYKKLKDLFSHMFLTPVHYPAGVHEAMTQLKAVINAELMDYAGYLNVKIERNITMTTYIDDFPGLIHFIFVDRHFHQMTAPSFNISLKEGECMDATSYLKQKVWTMHQHMMKKLMEGYSTIMIKDGDFYFSYFLWFEDYTGNPLPVQESLKPMQRKSPPGTMSGSFYGELLQQCFPHAIKGSVHCFEMFLMHLGTVHPQYISTQCKKLAHKMWEMSGEAYTTVSLF